MNERASSADGAPSAWTVRGLVRALAIACFAASVGAGLGYLIAHEPPPGSRSKQQETPPPEASPASEREPAGEAELALVAPLREGGPLEGFRVTEIHAVDGDGLLRLVCRKGGAAVKLDVALRSEGGPEPPAFAGRYAVFYATEAASPAQGAVLARALAAILAANAAVPVPPKLGPFVPRGR